MKRLKKACALLVAMFLLASSLIFCCGSPLPASASEKADLIIATKDDLFEFSQRVNAGETFEGKRVVQTANINLDGDPFTPIGLYGKGNYFLGVYDGKGHTVAGLNISKDCGTSNNGFFGQLGGTVMNLGLIDGEISGACCGSFASHASSSKAMIVNCFSTLSLNCSRTGGIADNFIGSIANCVYYHPTQKHATVGYNATKLYHTFASKKLPSSFGGTQQNNKVLGNTITKSNVSALNKYRATVFVKLSLSKDMELHGWQLENGKIGFSNKTIRYSSARVFVYLSENTPVIWVLTLTAFCLCIVGASIVLENRLKEKRKKAE